MRRSLGGALVLVAACGGDEGAAPGSSGASGSSGGAVQVDGGASSGGVGSSSGQPGPGPCGAGQGRVCDVGEACAADADCEGTCTAAVCAAPTHTDGKKSPSLGETDIDCGGATAPACSDGQGCAADGDCTSAACGAELTCVPSASCKGQAGAAGIATCGAGETGANGAVHESCCRSLPLPVTTTRSLDRYEITAGRLRAFVAAMGAGGEPNVRAFAHEYAGAHPGSQLASLATDFPGLLDVLPDHGSPSGALPLPVHLGAFPMDPINALDGCYVGNDAYGHGTYWQPPEDVAPYSVGIDGTGVRVYGREILDEKPVNCVMPMFLATFCAWDGGELATTTDYHEIWGNHPFAVGALTVKVPWSSLLPIGDFNWRNGHGGACGNLAEWPGGCLNPQPSFYGYPADGNPANDDSPAIGAPGRFVRDVTAITSASGEGWLDVGGSLMEAAWPNGAVDPGANPIKDVCDASASPAGGEVACSRSGGGVRRYQGNLQFIALVGYSFEGHSRRSEAYLAAPADDPSLLKAGDLKPVSFQYGKVGGRCARPSR